MLQLSILDFGEVNHGSDREKIAGLLDVVPRTEELGFHRYWLAEHYEAGAAWKNPEVLLGILAGLTDRLRIGVAGVLLNLHSPLRVALNFRMLELLYPGRIDLGVARGRTDASTEQRLRGGSEVATDGADYPARVGELVGYLRDGRLGDGADALALPPGLVAPPAVWVLGSGYGSLPIAVDHRTNFCLSAFHNATADHPRILREYRATHAARHGERPRTTVAVCGTCATTRSAALASVARNHLARTYRPNYCGTPEECHAQLLALRDAYAADELVLLDLGGDYEAKLQSYRLLSEACGLRGAEPTDYAGAPLAAAPKL